MKEALSHRSLDSVDRRILRLLQADGRMSNADLAERVGLSPAACHRRLKALEASGAITGYVALVDPRVGGRTQTAFVQITLSGQDGDDLEAFETAVTAHPQILACYLMTGSYDYLLHVLIRDAEEYELLHRKVLTRLPKVTRVTSSFAIRQVCHTHAVPLDP